MQASSRIIIIPIPIFYTVWQHEDAAKIAVRNPLQPPGDARSRRQTGIMASRRLRSVHGGNLMGLGRFLDVWACFLSDELHRSALADMGAAPMSGRF